MALEITTSESFEQTVRRALREIKLREKSKEGQLKDDLPLLKKMLTSFQPLNTLKEDIIRAMTPPDATDEEMEKIREKIQQAIMEMEDYFYDLMDKIM